MNACSGRTFAVLERFWKSGARPHPAVDAVTQVDHPVPLIVRLS
jgi:hypothetical protein